MKRLYLISILMLCAVMTFAQNDYDTETGIRYFKNENYQSALPYSSGPQRMAV